MERRREHKEVKMSQICDARRKGEFSTRSDSRCLLAKTKRGHAVKSPRIKIAPFHPFTVVFSRRQPATSRRIISRTIAPSLQFSIAKMHRRYYCSSILCKSVSFQDPRYGGIESERVAAAFATRTICIVSSFSFFIPSQLPSCKNNRRIISCVRHTHGQQQGIWFLIGCCAKIANVNASSGVD